MKHRRWTNINRFEFIFLALGVLATIVTDGLTIYRVATVPNNKDPDFVYGILIIISSRMHEKKFKNKKK